MFRIILLGGMLAILVALAFKITTPEVAQQRAAAAEPIEPAIFTKQNWQKLRQEMASP